MKIYKKLSINKKIRRVKQYKIKATLRNDKSYGMESKT